jgi:hypothetical protein
MNKTLHSSQESKKKMTLLQRLMVRDSFFEQKLWEKAPWQPIYKLGKGYRDNLHRAQQAVRQRAEHKVRPTMAQTGQPTKLEDYWQESSPKHYHHCSKMWRLKL